jgi:hypothetical protein
MLRVSSQQDVLDEEKKDREDKKPSEASERLITNLSSYIQDRWEVAKRSKDTVQDQMLVNLRQRNGEYEPDKKAAIAALKGSDAFIMLTDTKCRTAVDWIKDIMLQPGKKPWSIEPTPEPELPVNLEAMVKAKMMATAMEQASMAAAYLGEEPDIESIHENIMAKMPEMKDHLRKAYSDKAKEVSLQTSIRLEDQLVEGGFYEALGACLSDLVTLKAAVIKGPVLRHDKVRRYTFDRSEGRFKSVVREKIIPTFERRSPFDIYPAPDATSPDDGYLFDKITLTRRQVYDLIGLPGVNEKAVREVLKMHKAGDLRNWTDTDLESDKKAAEGETDTLSNVYESEKIDVLEFWDDIPGDLLVEWGMPKADVPDEDAVYSCCAWLIGDKVVKAVLNQDELGLKPFSVASYEEIEDSFWGKGIPELIADVQGICNAIVRALVNNVGISSGPQVEINTNRFPANYPTNLYPWKVWESNDQGIATAPAIKIYNIPLNAEKLVMAYNHFSKMADDHSGIPSYAHGDTQVGGAGNTASGLSMLMSSSSRGIKAVVRTIDKRIIEECVSRLYYLDIDYGLIDDLIFDMKIVARGSSALLAKEQQAVRLVEFLQSTNNPVDIQIMGMDGRAELLKQAAHAQDIDTDRIIPEGPKPINGENPPPQIGDNKGSLPAPATLDVAGNKAQGEDTRLISHEQTPQMRT